MNKKIALNIKTFDGKNELKPNINLTSTFNNFQTNEFCRK